MGTYIGMIEIKEHNKKIKKDVCLLPLKNARINFDFMELFITAIQKVVIKSGVLFADKNLGYKICNR